jgi:hypothetical protein
MASSSVYTSTRYTEDVRSHLQPSVARREHSDIPNDDFDYLYFAKFLALRNVSIIQLSELFSTDELAESLSVNRAVGAGRFMKVVLLRRNDHTVAVKLPIVAAEDPTISSRRVEHNQFMNNIFFEIQIMAHARLSEHPNIVKMLGLSFFEQEPDWLFPILVLEAANHRYPDLQQFV